MVRCVLLRRPCSTTEVTVRVQVASSRWASRFEVLPAAVASRRSWLLSILGGRCSVLLLRVRVLYVGLVCFFVLVDAPTPSSLLMVCMLYMLVSLFRVAERAVGASRLLLLSWQFRFFAVKNQTNTTTGTKCCNRLRAANNAHRAKRLMGATMGAMTGDCRMPWHECARSCHSCLNRSIRVMPCENR